MDSKMLRYYSSPGKAKRDPFVELKIKLNFLHGTPTRIWGRGIFSTGEKSFSISPNKVYSFQSLVYQL
jgi:hypothetical protein